MLRSLLFAAGVLAASIACAQENAVQRGHYLVYAGGCITCHSVDDDENQALAGGRALESPFGTFYSPNITPNEETGIGSWTDDEFLSAFWEGVGPDSRYYFPAFPYTSYTGLTREDLLAIKAYLFTLEPVRRENRPHELPWYLDTRLAAAAWQLLKLEAGRFEPDPAQSPEWNRGAYLVRHLGHCGECHTPRDALGGSLADREMAGIPKGGDYKAAPNISAHPDDGIGGWSRQELELLLEIGMLPDGDFVGGGMAAVVDDNTSQLTREDRRAIAVYLESLPPQANAPAD